MKYLAIGFLCVLAFLAAAVARGEESARQGGSFDSAGVRIAYAVAGQGEPVILVHGLYSSEGMNWEFPGTFKLLAEHYRVIAPDLRGHGLSDKPQEEAAYGQPMVDDILRLMDHLKVQKAHVVGYSLGGIVMMKFMIDHPDRVLTGTLGGMGYLRQGSVFQGVFERMSGSAGEGAGKTPPACVHGIARLAVRDEQVKGVRLPVHIFVGDRDPCRRMYVEPLQKIRPDWHVTLIPGAGHLTCIAQKEFKEGVLKWLQQQLKAK